MIPFDTNILYATDHTIYFCAPIGYKLLWGKTTTTDMKIESSFGLNSSTKEEFNPNDD